MKIQDITSVLASTDIRINLVKIGVGFAILWLVLAKLAEYLGSYRGERGLVIGVAVVTAAVLWEQLLGQRGFMKALRALGFRKSATHALLWTLVMSLALVGFVPLYAVVTGTPIKLRSDWLFLLPGLFAQGGIAEETVFRGYLFRHIRNYQSFWRSALLSVVPFAVAHFPLLHQLTDVAYALMSLLVALSVGVPLAWLFECSGRSIWPPAIVHFIMQAGAKIVEMPDTQWPTFVTLWMVVCLLLPWSVFLLQAAPSRSVATNGAREPTKPGHY
jgi:membrane protease YdiL (CAAX protease family)